MSDEVSDVPSRRFRPRFSLLVLMLVMTGICILLAWIAQPERVTATALFEVSSGSESPFRDPSVPFDEKGFDVLKRTQIAKLKSNYVLTAAVRNPSIAGLPLLKGKPDVVEWLSQNIEVGFPEDGEILEISVTGLKSHASDIIQVVDAVAKAYKDEVIGAERQRRLGVRDLLSRNFEDLNEEIKRDLNEYTDLAREIGSIESASGQVLKELDAKRLDRIDEELMRLETEAANDAAKAESLQPRFAQLRERQTALEKQLTERAEESADLQLRRSQLESLQRAATEIAVKLQLIDIEASAPDEIRQIQQAVIKPNN